MTEWRDCTSYRQGERLAGAEPRAWTASLGRTRMTVVKGHLANPDRWTLHCAPWFDTHDMGIPATEPAERAQSLAVKLVGAELGRAMTALDQLTPTTGSGQ